MGNALQSVTETFDDQKAMTCEEFFDSHFESICDDWVQEAYWNNDWNTDKVFEAMQKSAAEKGIILSDCETWDSDKFLHNVWKCTEKGLS